MLVYIYSKFSPLLCLLYSISKTVTAISCICVCMYTAILYMCCIPICIYIYIYPTIHRICCVTILTHIYIYIYIICVCVCACVLARVRALPPPQLPTIKTKMCAHKIEPSSCKKHIIRTKT